MRLTIAVDDMVSAPAAANAQLNWTSISIKMLIIDSMVTTTCNPPSPNTKRRMALSLGKENSRPMLNIRKTIPISPK